MLHIVNFLHLLSPPVTGVNSLSPTHASPFFPSKFPSLYFPLNDFPEALHACPPFKEVFSRSFPRRAPPLSPSSAPHRCPQYVGMKCAFHLYPSTGNDGHSSQRKGTYVLSLLSHPFSPCSSSDLHRRETLTLRTKFLGTSSTNHDSSAKGLGSNLSHSKEQKAEPSSSSQKPSVHGTVHSLL